jgi:hypothetical protein
LLRHRTAWILGVVAALIVGLCAFVLIGHRSPCKFDKRLSPSCGTWWGVALPATDSHLVTAIDQREQSAGRRQDIVHTYHRWLDVFPTKAESTLASTGHLLFLNWEPRTPDGRPVHWSEIATGSQDQVIDAAAHRLAALGQPILVSFSHEPELNFSTKGSAADFRNAFRHVVTRARAAGATNVRWVWNVMGLADPVWLGRYQQLWPGNDVVDWVAWDPYNFASCNNKPWKSFSQTVKPFYDWLESHHFGDKPFMLAEYGTIEDPQSADRKANWLAGIPHALASMPNLRALLYFDLPTPPASCDWRTDTSAISRTAFDKLADNPRFSWPSEQRIGR